MVRRWILFGGGEKRWGARLPMGSAALLLAALAVPGVADTLYWTGINSNFSDPSNWTTVANWGQCGMVVNGVTLICPANTAPPGPGDIAVLGTAEIQPGTRAYYNPVAGPSVDVGNLYVYDGNHTLSWPGTFEVSNQIVIGQPPGASLVAGDVGPSALTLNGGNGPNQILSTQTLEIAGNLYINSPTIGVQSAQTVLSSGSIQVIPSSSLQASNYLVIGTAPFFSPQSPATIEASAVVSDYGNISAGYTLIGFNSASLDFHAQ